MEIEFIVVRVGMGASNVLHHIHGVAVQVDIIFAVGVRADFHSADKLIVGIVGDRHVPLGFHDDLIGAGVVDGDLALALEVVRLFRDVGICFVGFRTAAQQDRCGQREGKKDLFMMLSFLFGGHEKSTMHFAQCLKIGMKKPRCACIVVHKLIKGGLAFSAQRFLPE